MDVKYYCIGLNNTWTINPMSEDEIILKAKKTNKNIEIFFRDPRTEHDIKNSVTKLLFVGNILASRLFASKHAQVMYLTKIGLV